MNTLKKMDFCMAGLAIFAMFFGAGNIIFPLALGQHALDKTPWALSGLLLTAVAMPFTGFLAMLRYEGQIRRFFSRFGKIPGFCLATLTIALLGPFGAAPRCITLAYSTIATSFPSISLMLFSGLACVAIFFFAYRENKLLNLLGYGLSPFMVTLLVWSIFKGFMEVPEDTFVSLNSSGVSHFWHGLVEGYNTMDLLAAFFFAPIIFSSLGKENKDKDFNHFVLKACVLGAFLLAIIYIGFSFLAYTMLSS